MATKKTSRKKTSLRNHPIIASMNFRNPAMLAAITIMALTGVYLVVRLLAAQITAFEAEGDRTGSVALVSDSGASGGQYIQFGGVSGTNPPPPVTPPPPPPTDPPPPPPVTPPPPPPSGSGQRCQVNLHGKSGYGSASYQSGDVTVISPNGNAEGWGGLQWLYFPESGYQEVKSIVASAINSQTCGQIVINGFSNGGGAAAKLYCRGETFGGKIVGYFINDPVPDAGVDSCTPNVANVHMFRSGSLEGSIVGGDCGGMDWTCEGGVLYPLSTYVSKLHLNSSQYNLDQNSGHSESPQTGSTISGWWN